ncbi:MAG: hypothetical protein V3U37_00315 [Nitrospinaceae bacterium]
MIKRIVLTAFFICAWGLSGVAVESVWAHDSHEKPSPFFKSDHHAHPFCPLHNHVVNITCPHLHAKHNSGKQTVQIAQECGGLPDAQVPGFFGFDNNPSLEETVFSFIRAGESEEIFIPRHTYQTPFLESLQPPPKSS